MSSFAHSKLSPHLPHLLCVPPSRPSRPPARPPPCSSSSEVLDARNVKLVGPRRWSSLCPSKFSLLVDDFRVLLQDKRAKRASRHLCLECFACRRRKRTSFCWAGGWCRCSCEPSTVLARSVLPTTETCAIHCQEQCPGPPLVREAPPLFLPPFSYVVAVVVEGVCPFWEMVFVSCFLEEEKRE